MVGLKRRGGGGGGGGDGRFLLKLYILEVYHFLEQN